MMKNLTLIFISINTKIASKHSDLYYYNIFHVAIYLFTFRMRCPKKKSDQEETFEIWKFL